MHGSLRTLLAASGLIALAALALVPTSAAAKTPRAYVVQPGDTLWELARDNGCSVEGLREANAMGPEDPLVVGRELDLSRCSRAKAARAAKSKSKAAPRRYTVVAGDNLSTIARKHKTTVEALRELNDIEGSMIRVGQVLTLPGAANPRREIRLLTGQSRGRPGHGWLHAASALPRSPHYYRRRTERIYAAAHVIDYTINAVLAVKDAFPKVHSLAIGDLSDRDGGPLSGHASHQSGRDIDIGLFYTRKPVDYPKEFVAASEDSLDADATWALVEALVRTADEPGGVEKIFLDYEVQGWLYAAARRDGWSKRALVDVFQYPDGRFAKHGMVRHEPKHDDHLHVRFACAPDDQSCS
ncbi:penicillin-insensitive murein endopeptidase [Pseudenhygromyxa sp. WMMC2535]|uniref:penicillin-insensitive murein endopeptidase n=1 Tax=Pseudenhygromyxa sp. WMMC2535 TaxID=2712867 RepID=UPI001552DC16|nr:penicillin-insensitive murein endopeptidase [Pseudenhygromyxa sp. WMMC2535]NVB39334.1 penicillin-insensitive murein endopeptidase [Pseudenhygromyxa sp. WMMC2535]